MSRAIAPVLAALVLTPLGLPLTRGAEPAKRPNVVFIMTDNHGAWTLGCYGNKDIRTPHIDRLAAEGTLFANAFASNPVCSPTRATFLTGLLPSQHGVHSFLAGGRLQTGPDARCTLDAFTSLPEVLHEEGYRCGLVGKWHLGDNLNPQEGLDDYWITMPHGGTSTFYGAKIIEDGEIREEPEYLTDFWTRHAVKFIERSADDERPFFLFLAYNGPYSLGRLLLKEGRNRHAEYYRDQELPSFPRDPVHPWQYNNIDYQNNPTSIRRIASEVSGVDDGVGTVMKTLEQLGIDDNTLVVFVADQGWVGGHGGFFGMGDHTRPLTARDGMMRIPMIWRQPGVIASGSTSERPVTNYDFMPTLLSHLGLEKKMPTAPKSPGRDFSPELTKAHSLPDEPDYGVFYEFENLRCIRTPRWKFTRRFPNGPDELYDLQTDPDEFDNLVSDPEHAATRDELNKRLEVFYAHYAEPKYDMWNGGGSQARVFDGIDEELAQAPPVEPPPLTNGFSPAKLNVPEGFTVDLAAGPPLVNHPTMACFDNAGKLYVCDNAGVNLKSDELEAKLPNTIRVLEDTDDDGRFDKSTVFADRMTYPMGGVWHEGALYVASPPNIWRLEDTDGDNVADRRDILVGKFGYTGNAASIHGCFKGPDGRLYWTDGYHGHEFKDDEGKITSKREGSYIFSCWPDGTDVRIHCGGGMDNPVELDFTDEGEMLGTVNIMHSRPRVDGVAHWLLGGAYPHRERVLKELKTTGDLLDLAHRFGHVAVSGMTRYRSGVLDHHWRDNLFATFFNTGKVVRLQLARDGASYTATQREFLSGTSRDFHPTDVLEDADGSLLVIDTGGWFYNGCPTSQLSKPDVLGAIYRVRRDRMTTQVDPWGKRIAWEALSPRELIKSLNDTRFKVRERAVAECVHRGTPMVPSLRSSLQRGDIGERRLALEALSAIAHQQSRTPSTSLTDQQSAPAAMRVALDDRTASIRQLASRTIGPDPKALPRLLEILADDVPPARAEAANALGRLRNPKAIGPLLLALARPEIDRTEEHAILYALLAIDQSKATRKGLASKHPAVRRGALIALDQMDSGSLDADTLTKHLGDADEALAQRALAIFSRRYQQTSDAAEKATYEKAAAERLGQWLDDDHDQESPNPAIEELASAFASSPAVARLVGEALGQEQAPQQLSAALLRAIAGKSGRPLDQTWIEPIESRLASNDPAEVERAISAVSAIKSDHFAPKLTALAKDDKRSGLLRVAAMEALARGSKSPSPEAFGILVELIESGGPAESARAAQMLGGSSLNKQQLLALAPQLEAVGPGPLRDLIRPYRSTRDPEVVGAFLSSLEEARGLLSLPETEVSDVVKRYPEKLRPQANALLAKLKSHKQTQLAKVDGLLASASRGDATRGQALFHGEKAKCATCHRVGDKGGRIGPDLTTIGASRARRDLLESILFPSATIVRQYEPYTVVTDTGRILTGLIVREDTDSLTLQQQVGDPFTIPRDEIDELVPSTVSIMPKGIDETLSQQELADLIAYLVTRK
ncbi:Arylsulfatase precursor [Planctomycetes bacterium Pan216]|uniref:Arylsulfatase n=1 Tax=Kolteria novifilia TaxID=2527975 RepID=A0A518B9H1_9BACT|nr:Arylsulfatase precursor [Planctomycetes bacterium Pan216]